MPCRTVARHSGVHLASAVGLPARLIAYVLNHSLGLCEALQRADDVLPVWQVRSEHEAERRVVGVGSCGLDYLAVVAKYPVKDTKLRTENLEVRLPINQHVHRQPYQALTSSRRSSRVKEEYRGML